MVRELGERVVEFGIDGGEPAAARDNQGFVVWFCVL
jgi:hypothetical protein